MENKIFESWQQWFPAEKLAQEYLIESILKRPKTLVVSLYEASDEDNKLTLHFENSVVAYRSTYETLRHQLIVDLRENYDKEFYQDCSFFIIEDSEYIKSLNSQYSNTDLVHYVILTDDCALDIISNNAPIVKK